jgi:hypothetical protein
VARDGRERVAASSNGLDGIAGILDLVKSSECEKAQLRTALERIQGSSPTWWRSRYPGSEHPG